MMVAGAGSAHQPPSVRTLDQASIQEDLRRNGPTTLVTMGIDSEAKVKEVLASHPDGCTCTFKVGNTLYKATKANGQVTCAPVSRPSAHVSQLAEVTDDAILRIVGTEGPGRFSIPQSYAKRIVPKGHAVKFALDGERPPEIYVLSRKRNDSDYFDMQGYGVNFSPSHRNEGGARRKEPEHSGDVIRQVNGQNWLEHRLTGWGYKDGNIFLTGYRQKRCIEFGTAVMCYVDHETEMVYLDVFYNRAEEIGENSTFQVVATIIANEDGNSCTALSIPSEMNETAFPSRITIPYLRDDQDEMRKARAYVEEAKDQYARDQEARAQRLTGENDGAAATTRTAIPPPPRPRAAAGAKDCVYFVLPGASVPTTGKKCPKIYIGPNGLSTQPPPRDTPQSFAGLITYLAQAFYPRFTMISDAVHTRVAVSTSEIIPEWHRMVVCLTEESIKDGERHNLGYFHNTLFILTSPKTETLAGEQLMKALRANIVSGLGDGSWCVVKAKNAAGKTVFLHCAGGMDFTNGLHELGEDVTPLVEKLLANPKRRLPAGALVTKEVMISDPFHPGHLIGYEDAPKLFKEWMSEENVLRNYLQKNEIIQWLERVTVTVQVLPEEAVMELVDAFGQVQKELVANYGDLSSFPPMGPDSIGTEEYKRFKEQKSKRDAFAGELKTLLHKHFYSKMQRGTSGTGRLGVGPKLAARAVKMNQNKNLWQEMQNDPEKWSEHFEQDGMMVLMLPTDPNLWHNAMVGARIGKYNSPFAVRAANGRTAEPTLPGHDLPLLALPQPFGCGDPNHAVARADGKPTLACADRVSSERGGNGSYLFVPLDPVLDSGDGRENFTGSSATWSIREKKISITIQMFAALISRQSMSTRDLETMDENDPRVMRWVCAFLADVMLKITRRSTSNIPVEGEHQTMCKRLSVLLSCAWGTGLEKITSSMCFFSSDQRAPSYHFVPSQWREFAKFLYCTFKLTDWRKHLYKRLASYLVTYFNRLIYQKRIAATLREEEAEARDATRDEQGSIKKILEGLDYHNEVANCYKELMERGEIEPSRFESVRYLGGTRSSHRHDCYSKERIRRRNPYLLLSGEQDLANLNLAGIQERVNRKQSEWSWKTVLRVVLLGKMVKDLKRLWNFLPRDDPGRDDPGTDPEKRRNKMCSTMWGTAPEFLYHSLGGAAIASKLQTDIDLPPDLEKYSKEVSPQPMVHMVNTPAVRDLVKLIRKTYGDRNEAYFHFVYFWPDWKPQQSSPASSGGTASCSAAAASETDTSASSTETPAMEEVATPAQRRAAFEPTLKSKLAPEDWECVSDILYAKSRAPQLIAKALGMDVNMWHGFSAVLGWTTETWADGMLAAMEAGLAPDIEDRIKEAMPTRTVENDQALPDIQRLLMDE